MSENRGTCYKYNISLNEIVDRTIKKIGDLQILNVIGKTQCLLMVRNCLKEKKVGRTTDIIDENINVIIIVWAGSLWIDWNGYIIKMQKIFKEIHKYSMHLSIKSTNSNVNYYQGWKT